MRLRWIRRDSTDWGSCVDLVRSRYLSEYGATVDPKPELFAALSKDYEGSRLDTQTAVAGVTFAESDAALFCEYYLDAPVEEVVVRALGLTTTPTRAGIVEIGPLAASSGGLGGALIRLVPSLCWCRGATAIVCTVSAPVAAQIRGVGIDLRTVGPARKCHLPSGLQENWGSYYDSGAEVAVIDLTHQGEKIIEPRTLDTASI